MNSTLSATDRYSLQVTLRFLVGSAPLDIVCADLSEALPHERMALLRTFELAYGSGFVEMSDLTAYICDNMR